MANDVISYSSLSFDEIQADLIAYITSKSEFSEQNTNGSNFQLLTKLLSYITTLLSYNINQAVNESFIGSVQTRDNINKIIEILNYVPRRKTSSLVDVVLGGIVWATPSHNLVKYNSIIGNGKKFYYVDEDRIELVGKPKIIQGLDFYTAEKVTIYDKGGRVVFEPKAELVIYASTEHEMELN